MVNILRHTCIAVAAAQLTVHLYGTNPTRLFRCYIKWFHFHVQLRLRTFAIETEDILSLCSFICKLSNTFSAYFPRRLFCLRISMPAITGHVRVGGRRELLGAEERES